MKTFRFSLLALLKLRRSQRDQCLQMLALAQKQQDELLRQREQLEAERASQMQELKQLGQQGKLDVDAAIQRRLYAGQLVGDVGQVEARRLQVAEQVAHCRRALMLADQLVKSLEKLEDKQRQEFLTTEQQRLQRLLEDNWSAAHAGDYRS